MPKVEAWGDGSGGALAVTAAFVEGTTIKIDEDTELHFFAALTGTDAVAIDLLLEASFDDETTWDTMPLPIVAISGDLDEKYFRTLVPARCKIRLSVRRRGGGVGTLAYVSLAIRQQIADWDETEPFITNRASALDAVLLTGAYQYGAWFDLGNADELELLLTKTLAGNPTQVDLQIQTSPNLGVTGYLPSQIDAIAAGIETRVATTKRITDIGAAVGTWSHLFTGLPKNSWCRVGAFFNGGTAPTIALMALCHRI